MTLACACVHPLWTSAPPPCAGGKGGIWGNLGAQRPEGRRVPCRPAVGNPRHALGARIEGTGGRVPPERAGRRTPCPPEAHRAARTPEGGASLPRGLGVTGRIRRERRRFPLPAVAAGRPAQLASSTRQAAGQARGAGQPYSPQPGSRWPCREPRGARTAAEPPRPPPRPARGAPLTPVGLPAGPRRAPHPEPVPRPVTEAPGSREEARGCGDAAGPSRRRRGGDGHPGKLVLLPALTSPLSPHGAEPGKGAGPECGGHAAQILRGPQHPKAWTPPGPDLAPPLRALELRKSPPLGSPGRLVWGLPPSAAPLAAVPRAVPGTPRACGARTHLPAGRADKGASLCARGASPSLRRFC